MRFNLTDTIAAIATPPGISALAVTRISGSEAITVASRIFSEPEKLLQAEGYKAVYGFITDGGGVIDEVVCLVFRAPHSYTGEDMVEISGHGNPDLTNRCLQLLLRSCRPAEPGEFTFRAFMNHKLDLVQAEAVNDLIQAQTGKAETAALSQLKGNLSRDITAIIETLSDCRMRFELSIDFADQDLPELDLQSVKAQMETSLGRLKELSAGGRQGRILRDGLSVCLCGAPNVGKSSLFNKFLKENRAIVTPQPGTTRDYLQEWLSLDGFPVKLTDTAGLRDAAFVEQDSNPAADEVEKIGIERTGELLTKADLIILLTDPETLGSERGKINETYEGRTIRILNKVDLLGFETLPGQAEWNEYLKNSRFGKKIKPDQPLIPCSAYLEDGITALRKMIVSRISLSDLSSTSVLVTNTRHLAAIDKAVASLEKALQGIAASAGDEFIAFDLIETISALSEITGAVTTDELLDRIFSGFCIGK